MSDNIDIVVKEQGVKQAADGMRTLAASSLKAADNISRLNNEMRGLKLGSRVVNDMQKLVSMAQKLIGSNNSLATSSNKLTNSLLRNQEAESRLALSRQRLATETARTQQVMARVEAEIQKGIIATTKSQTADAALAAGKVKLQAETVRLGTAQTQAAIQVQRLAEQSAKAATAQQRLTTEQQKTVEAMNRAATAAQNLSNSQAQAAIMAARLSTEQGRAQVAATMAQTAQANLAAATSRAQAAATNAATATANLASAQQRTQTAAAQAAAAQDRAAIASIRLAEAQRRAGTESRNAAGGLADFARNTAAIVGGGAAVMTIGKMADGYTTLQNKLVNLSPDMVTTNKLMDEMFELANRTRQPVESTTQAFQRFDNAMKDMGASQAESLRMTETVNKAIIVSGASASESAAGLLQLAQAFGSGRLQGDEFRSIMENMPVLADMIAKSMGVTRSELKKLSTDGKITSQVMRKAFAEAATDIDAKFGKTVPTMGQAMNVLRNNTMRMVGELDQSLGVTKAISQGMLLLADNMKLVTLAATAAGAAMLAAYGPNLVGVLNRARVAMLALNTAVLANPVLAVAAALATLTAAVMLFGDKVKVSSDGFVTLRDVAVGAFNMIKSGAVEAAGMIKDAWNGLIDIVSEMTGGWGEQFRDLFSFLLNLAKNNLNKFIGTFVGTYNAIKKLWETAPELFKDVFANIVNFAATAAETVVNSWQTALRLAASGVEKFAPETAKAMTEGLDKLKLELPRMEVGKGVKAGLAEIGEEFKKSVDVDYIGAAGDKLMAAARAASQDRIKAADAEAKAQLRAAGAAQNKAADPSKESVKRAAAMARINAELDNEIARMGILKPLRDDMQRFDAIEEKLLGKKIQLNKEETTSLKEKIAKIREGVEVQAAMDSIYEDAIGPLRDYNNQTKAAKQLLDQGAISQAKYEQAVVKAKEAYTTATDPLKEFNKALQEQQHLNQFNPANRESETQFLGIKNELLAKGIVLTKQQQEALRGQIAEQQSLNALTAAHDEIWRNSVGAVRDLATMQTALNQAYASGAITQTLYTAEMAKTNVQMAELQNKLGNGDVFSVFTAGMGQVIQGYQSLATSAADIIGNVMTTAVDGISDSIAGAIVKGENLRETLSNLGQTILTQLISSLIKMGIQYMLNAAMASTAIATTTAAGAAAAAATATAWAPAAAMVSLGTMGANGPLAVASISAANAASMSFAALAGFQKGGYTGDGGVSQVAGLVHGKEYVMNAATVSRVGVDTLDNIQNGGEAHIGGSYGGMPMGFGSAPQVTITIINNAEGTTVRESRSQDEQGNQDIRVQIDNIETTLAARIDSGQGPLSTSIQKNYGVEHQTIRR